MNWSKRFCRPLPNHSAMPPIKKAGDGVRTRDLLLGKQKLYQLSYSRLNYYFPLNMP